MTDYVATMGDEAAILDAIRRVYGGPFVCSNCSAKITPETGWKPRTAFIGNEDGVWRAFVDILCGTCISLGVYDAHPRSL